MRLGASSSRTHLDAKRQDVWLIVDNAGLQRLRVATVVARASGQFPRRRDIAPAWAVRGTSGSQFRGSESRLSPREKPSICAVTKVLYRKTLCESSTAEPRTRARARALHTLFQSEPRSCVCLCGVHARAHAYTSAHDLICILTAASQRWPRIIMRICICPQLHRHG